MKKGGGLIFIYIQSLKVQTYDKLGDSSLGIIILMQNF